MKEYLNNRGEPFPRQMQADIHSIVTVGRAQGKEKANERFKEVIKERGLVLWESSVLSSVVLAELNGA